MEEEEEEEEEDNFAMTHAVSILLNKRWPSTFHQNVARDMFCQLASASADNCEDFKLMNWGGKE